MGVYQLSAVSHQLSAISFQFQLAPRADG